MVETFQERVFSYVQDIFRPGIVIVVGSGASCGYGLPGMGALTQHLLEHIPDRLPDLTADCVREWDQVAAKLKNNAGLESAMAAGNLPAPLVDTIADLVAGCIKDSEQNAIAKILSNTSPSAFGRLFQHILRTAPVADVITTNYDRLIEVHAARASVRVDSMYYGHTIGRLDQDLSRAELYQAKTIVGRGRNTALVQHPHVRLSKPHGSLDWFSHEDRHYRSDLAMPGARRIIAPGGNKYRLGYEAPFDVQRARANKAIDGASTMLFVGYGFNDEHLQTHILPRFPEVDAVVVSRELTDNARSYLDSNPAAIGIEAASDDSRCRVTQGSDIVELDFPLWDLEHLTKEVLNI